MAIVTLFKHRKQAVRLTAPNGRTYQVTMGRIFTQIPEEEADLKKMVGKCGLYIDAAEPTIDTEAADPMSIMQKNMRQQLLDELRGAGVQIPDSVSEQGGMGKGLVSTSSSTLMANGAADRVESQRIEEKAEAIVQNVTQAQDPALSALERLKLGSQTPAS